MPITYSCFISYRHDSVQIARDFQDALENELSLLIDLPVFRDEERLRPGDFFNRELEMALCKSACMVVIYIPRYFDERSTYCAREYRAMELLETQRLENLKKVGVTHNSGLIIPIIYRGRDVLPVYISNNRQFHDFETFYLGGRTQRGNKRYLTAVKDIADYIFRRCRELNSLPSDPCDCCGTFEIPKTAEISDWIGNVLPPRPIFPGREG
jgi:hypothetical protein